MSTFQLLDDEGRFGPDVPEYIPTGDDPRRLILCEMAHLADAARAFFTGIYPKESPYFWWGEGVSLPWAAEYWTTKPDGEGRSQGPISDDLCIVVARIVEARSTLDPNPHQITFLMYGPDAPKEQVQSLAGELLLTIDESLELLLGGHDIEAFALMFEAHKYISEMTQSAIYLLPEIGAQAMEAIQRIRAGAAKGGKASAAARRTQSRVPAPAALRVERERLIASGKAEREVASILAQRFLCTPDHIRKLLARD